MEITREYTFSLGLVVYSLFAIVHDYASYTFMWWYRNLKPTCFYSKYLLDYAPYFFTAWTFIIQVTFVHLALVEELSRLIARKRIRFFTRLRSFVFTVFLFPNTILVLALFWSLYFIDREYVYPKCMDDDLPTYVNLFAHVLIILPVIMEFFLQRKQEFLPVKGSLLILFVYLVCYNVLYVSVYFEHGFWLYPFYDTMTKMQVLLWIIFLILGCLGIEVVGEKIQIYLERLCSNDERDFEIPSPPEGEDNV